jgi:exopolysaccharide biosynthesis protein
LFGIIYIIYYGPSPAARNLFVLSVMETSSAKFLATWFFTPEQIDEFIAENSPKAFTEEIDETIVSIPPKDEEKTEDETVKDIEVVDVKGPNYKGKMMIVKDPSRVFLATSPQFGSEEKGEKLVDLITKNIRKIFLYIYV